MDERAGDLARDRLAVDLEAPVGVERQERDGIAVGVRDAGGDQEREERVPHHGAGSGSTTT